MIEPVLLLAKTSPQLSSSRSRLESSKLTGCRGMSKPSQAPANSSACQEFALGTWMTRLPAGASISSTASTAALGSRSCSSICLPTITSNAPGRKHPSGSRFRTTDTPADEKCGLTGRVVGATATTARPRRRSAGPRSAPPPRSSTVPPSAQPQITLAMRPAARWRAQLMRRRTTVDGSSSRIHSRFSVAASCGGAGLIRTNRQSAHSRTSKVPGWPRNLSRVENSTEPDGLQQDGQWPISGDARSSHGVFSSCTVNDEGVRIVRANAVECKCPDGLGADCPASCPTCKPLRVFSLSRYPTEPRVMLGLAAPASLARSNLDRAYQSDTWPRSKPEWKTDSAKLQDSWVLGRIAGRPAPCRIPCDV